MNLLNSENLIAMSSLATAHCPACYIGTVNGFMTLQNNQFQATSIVGNRSGKSLRSTTIYNKICTGNIGTKPTG